MSKITQAQALDTAKNLWTKNPAEFIVALASRNNPTGFMAAAKHVLAINNYEVNANAKNINQFDKLFDAFINDGNISILKQVLALFTFKLDGASWTVKPSLWQELGAKEPGDFTSLLNQLQINN